MKLGEQIRILRVKKGMTQLELAEQIGSTKSSISNYERGQSSPPYAVLHAIAGALGIPASELLAYTSDEREADSAAESQADKSPRRIRRLLSGFEKLTDAAQIKVLDYIDVLGLVPMYTRTLPGILQQYVSNRFRCMFTAIGDTEKEETYNKWDDYTCGSWVWRARHMVFCHVEGKDSNRWDFFYYMFDWEILDYDVIWHILRSADTEETSESSLAYVLDDENVFDRFIDCYTDRTSSIGAEYEHLVHVPPALFLLVEKGTWEIKEENECIPECYLYD